MFRRLPTDNFPDDFDTRAYRTYRELPGVWLRVLNLLPRIVFVVILAFALIFGLVITLLFLQEDEPTIMVITPQPTATVPTEIAGDFPDTALQSSITIPARIDNELGVSQQHGYRFMMSPGITWEISLTPYGALDPVMSLYNPDGILVDISAALQGRDGQLIFEATEAGQYGLVIEPNPSSASSGRYTLSILPQ